MHILFFITTSILASNKKEEVQDMGESETANKSSNECFTGVNGVTVKDEDALSRVIDSDGKKSCLMSSISNQPQQQNLEKQDSDKKDQDKKVSQKSNPDTSNSPCEEESDKIFSKIRETISAGKILNMEMQQFIAVNSSPDTNTGEMTELTNRNDTSLVNSHNLDQSLSLTKDQNKDLTVESQVSTENAQPLTNASENNFKKPASFNVDRVPSTKIDLKSLVEKLLKTSSGIYFDKFKTLYTNLFNSDIDANQNLNLVLFFLKEVLKDDLFTKNYEMVAKEILNRILNHDKDCPKSLNIDEKIACENFKIQILVFMFKEALKSEEMEKMCEDQAQKNEIKS